MQDANRAIKEQPFQCNGQQNDQYICVYCRKWAAGWWSRKCFIPANATLSYSTHRHYTSFHFQSQSVHFYHRPLAAQFSPCSSCLSYTFLWSESVPFLLVLDLSGCTAGRGGHGAVGVRKVVYMPCKITPCLYHRRCHIAKFRLVLRQC